MKLRWYLMVVLTLFGMVGGYFLGVSYAHEVVGYKHNPEIINHSEPLKVEPFAVEDTKFSENGEGEIFEYTGASDTDSPESVTPERESPEDITGTKEVLQSL